MHIFVIFLSILQQWETPFDLLKSPEYDYTDAKRIRRLECLQKLQVIQCAQQRHYYFVIITCVHMQINLDDKDKQRNPSGSTTCMRLCLASEKNVKQMLGTSLCDSFLTIILSRDLIDGRIQSLCYSVISVYSSRMFFNNVTAVLDCNH